MYPLKGTRDRHWGTQLGKDMGQVEVLWDADGVPPLGYICENNTFLILRMRVVPAGGTRESGEIQGESEGVKASRLAPHSGKSWIRH